MEKEQLAYVRTQLDSGFTPEAVRTALEEAGYDTQQIDDLLAAAQSESSVSPKPTSGEAEQTDTNDTPATKLPSVGQFIKQSWTPSYPLVQLAVVGVAGWSAATAALATFSGDPITESLGGWMAALTGLISIYVLTAIIAVILRPDCTTVSDGLKWANQNFASIWWLAILIVLVQISAYTLLIIPGIIVSVYVVLAYPVRVVEGVKGIQAMARSTALIHGQWWAVFGRLLVLFITVIPLYIVAGVASAVLSSQLDIAPGTVWVDAASWVISGISLAIYANAMSILYSHLVVGNTAAVPAKSTSRRLYIILAWLAPAVIFVPVVIMSSLNSARDSAQGAMDQLTLSNARMQAILYYNENDLSYDGLCAALPREVDCEATTDAYRLSLPISSNEIACIDSTEEELITVASIPSSSLECR